MEGIEVGLDEMLCCRERRFKQQEAFLAECHVPLVSFGMNIPGPVKTNQKIRAGFETGKERLLQKLCEEGAVILKEQETHESTGDELLLAVDLGAKRLKELAKQLEDSDPYGRLFDIDILDLNGKKLSRRISRKCLLCNSRAQECARSRKHSVRELQGAVERILGDDIQ